MEGQRVVEDEPFALASFGYGRFYSVPLFLAACVRVHLIDFQLGDVICQSDVVVLPEEAVGKYEGSVFVGGKDVFGGVVDGMRQQGDVIAPLLDIGDVLYVSFEDCVSTGAFLAGEGLLADIEHFCRKWMRYSTLSFMSPCRFSSSHLQNISLSSGSMCVM